MGMFVYESTPRRSTHGVPTAANLNMNNNNSTIDDSLVRSTLDMLASSNSEMGAACYKSNGSQYQQNRQSNKPNRHGKDRRTSFKRCKKVRGVDDIDSSLLDDFYNSQTKCILSKISDWSFDVFALEKASNGRALFHVILKLFQHHNLINHFQLDVVKLMTFATLVEEGYQNNPYHNTTHAADVTQAMHCYISQGKIAKHMTPLEVLISLVSAITHDLDHPGVNQGFLVATNNHLAALYENKAVLEKHHWRSALGVIHQTGLFDHLSEVVRSKIEIEMKSLILATDMTRQQNFLQRLRQRVTEDSLDMSSYEDRHFILQISLKCADISNPCRHWSACSSWSDRVCQEFFRQGDQERELELPISNLCDRYSNTVPKIQTGFIDYCVEPLFVEFEKYLFPSSMLSEQLINLKSNRNKWQEKIDSATKPAPVRPINLTIPPAAIDVNENEVPSPTQSDVDYEDMKDIEINEMCHHSIDRRHSLPGLLLEKTKSLLTRRQSFPDGPCHTRCDGRDDDYTVALLDQLAGKLTTFSKLPIRGTNEKQMTKILENILTGGKTTPHNSCHNSLHDISRILLEGL